MRKTVERITYRTLKAEIRALLDRPGVVPDADWRIMEWLHKRYWDRWKAENKSELRFEKWNPYRNEGSSIFDQVKGDLLKRIADESAKHSEELVKQIKAMKEQGE